MGPSIATKDSGCQQLNPLPKQAALLGGARAPSAPRCNAEENTSTVPNVLAKAIKPEPHQVSRSLSYLQEMPGMQERVGKLPTTRRKSDESKMHKPLQESRAGSFSRASPRHGKTPAWKGLPPQESCIRSVVPVRVRTQTKGILTQSRKYRLDIK